MYGFVLQLARFHLEVLGASSVLLLYHTIIFSCFKFDINTYFLHDTHLVLITFQWIGIFF